MSHEYEPFYDKADGVRSQQGWYYVDMWGVVCGPFYSERAAEQHAIEAREGESDVE